MVSVGIFCCYIVSLFAFYFGFRANLNSNHHAWGRAETYVITVVMTTIIGHFLKSLAGKASNQEVRLVL